ncbi:MAG: putative rane protein [Acidobacteriaceae bacterium]|nr:putative rane protein [Acidobacteriaceae bacterium]
MTLVNPAQKLASFAALTLLFAALGRIVRGVTTAGAIAGAAICFALLWAAGIGAFVALLTVFLLTWVATRVGYRRKQHLGTAEARTGRDALQVLANLGMAAGCAVLYATLRPDPRLLIAMAAALAEAAADTVSSEIGQALGGTPRLITTWRKVAPGTDGAITLAGTLAGAAAAIAVAFVCALAHIFEWKLLAVCAGAGVAGMFFDSLLGATLERPRVLGNNAVNFASTIIAAVLAFLLS